jgi:hypothetical protein
MGPLLFSPYRTFVRPDYETLISIETRENVFCQATIEFDFLTVKRWVSMAQPLELNAATSYSPQKIRAIGRSPHLTVAAFAPQDRRQQSTGLVGCCM